MTAIGLLNRTVAELHRSGTPKGARLHLLQTRTVAQMHLSKKRTGAALHQTTGAILHPSGNVRVAILHLEMVQPCTKMGAALHPIQEAPSRNYSKKGRRGD